MRVKTGAPLASSAAVLAAPIPQETLQHSNGQQQTTSFGVGNTIGSWSVGAAFQVGAKFGVGRCGGIEKMSLISLTSEERRTRPHMGER
jgi:hypothetical protein